MQQPKFNFADVKFAGGLATFKRAQDLYNAGKVDAIRETPLGYSATVLGTHAYKVSVSSKRVDDGHCDCYLGQNDRLCKHVLALALAVLTLSGKANIDSTESCASTDYLWSVVERLDKKLSNRVDDSDGFVGECVHKIIQQLADYAKASPDLVLPVKRLAEKKTSFDFEVELLARLKSSE